jgi:NDP-sugar pyrophosphorylase family protein
MVMLGGKPILAHVVDRLRAYGVQDIIMNLHHLPDRIQDYFEDGRTWGMSIRYSIEPTLLGTAGAVGRMADYLRTPFFVWYGDNLSNCKLDQLYRFHREHGGLASIALFQREDPTSSGIAEFNDHGRITRFLDKPAPEQVFSRWVNAGIYVLEPDVLAHIPSHVPSDFGRDVFPTMLVSGKSLYGYRMGPEEPLWWIDTAEDLERVRFELDRSVELGSTEGQR